MAVAVYAFGIFIVVTVMLLSYFLGPRGFDKARGLPYESGVASFGFLPDRFFVHYFMVAVAFVIFDLESVFLYVWASAIHDVGWSGLIKVGIFIGMLLLGLFYALSLGFLQVFSRTRQLRNHHERI